MMTFAAAEFVSHLTDRAATQVPQPATSSSGSGLITVIAVMIGVIFAASIGIRVIKVAINVVAKLVEVAMAIGTAVLAGTVISVIVLVIYIFQYVHTHLPT